jgi:SAM-dependent methyltransferase
MNVFENYAFYYDLLYKDKNYESEANYIDDLIKKYSIKANSILELGCGTGKHAILLVQKGYEIVGVDISQNMVDQAQKIILKNKSLGRKVSFSCADIRSLNLNKKFDAVISLFHVVSYQTTNQDLQKTFSVAKNHLNENGIFIFDCWYGPAVLTQKPETRIKRLENEKVQITRLAEPKIYANENCVDVNYQIYLHDKYKKHTCEFKETHKMRYLFKPEIELLLEQNGLKLVGFEEWESGKEPGFDSWGVCFVAKRI